MSVLKWCFGKQYKHKHDSDNSNNNKFDGITRDEMRRQATAAQNKKKREILQELEEKIQAQADAGYTSCTYFCHSEAFNYTCTELAMDDLKKRGFSIKKMETHRSFCSGLNFRISWC